MNRIFLILFLTVFTGCNQQKPVEEVDTTGVSLSDTLEVETNRVVSLLPEAQEKVSVWLEFATAHNQVEDLRNATGRDLILNSEPVVQIMEALNSSLPDSLQQVPVISRTTVLETKARVLNQAATKKEIDPEEVFEAANDIILEFDNFKLQLNEIFLKTPADFEQELDRQFKRNQDSLRALEKPEPISSPRSREQL